MPHSKGFRGRKDARSSEPVALGTVVDGLLGEEQFRRGLPVVTLLKQWPDLVGERLARAITPASLEAGTLTIHAADGPWGAQATYLAEEIRDRCDRALGRGSVKRVRIVVVDPQNRRSGR